MGQCFQWAWQNLLIDDALVHASISQLRGPHAWIERNGRVFDWQTNVLHWYFSKGLGQENYQNVGWPIDEFYAAFSPTNIVKYTFTGAHTLAAREWTYGPWNGLWTCPSTNNPTNRS